MSIRNLIAALTVLAVALAGGTAFASSNDEPAPVKKVQVDKTGKVTKTDETLKRDNKRMPDRRLKTKETPRRGDRILKVKGKQPVHRPAPEVKRMKTQDIKPAPHVERGTKPTTGPAPTKTDTTTKVPGPGGDDDAKTLKRDPKVVKGAPVEKREEPTKPSAPIERAPK
ncbi:MAG: hypothetical protein EP329_19825 [Deltaproteobacteria bacterium]|nr:MAG: hypothetical protein EP329_19825 [Deltaproteobacteria bacterium]